METEEEKEGGIYCNILNEPERFAMHTSLKVGDRSKTHVQDHRQQGLNFERFRLTAAGNLGASLN